MCTYSMVVDVGKKVPLDRWAPDMWNNYQEILDRVRKLDKDMLQPDCEDPTKKEWMDAVEKRIKALEDKDELQKVRDTCIGE